MRKEAIESLGKINGEELRISTMLENTTMSLRGNNGDVCLTSIA